MGNSLSEEGKGDLYRHAALVTGELFCAAVGRGAEGGSVLWVPGDVVWHRRGRLLPRCLCLAFVIVIVLPSFLPLLVAFGLRRCQDFSEVWDTWRKGVLALVLVN